MPELRREPINGRWIIIKNEKPKGPVDFDIETKSFTENNACPFCEGNEGMTPPEVHACRDEGEANMPGWDLRVIPNKYPALSGEGELDKTGIGVFDMMNGIGSHEVIIETPDHSRELSQLSENEFEKVIQTYRDRSLKLRDDSRFRYIMIFKNQGKTAGASLSHAHTQLIALPMIPKNVNEELKGALTYYEYKERCIFCDMANQELRQKERLIVENKNYVAFCPFASRFAFETWIIPKKHFAAFDYIPLDMVGDLAKILKDILQRINKLFKGASYNFIIHTSPIEKRIREEYHWHIEMMPKLTKVAGFEWGSGFYVNPTPPELAAKYLREVKN